MDVFLPSESSCVLFVCLSVSARLHGAVLSLGAQWHLLPCAGQNLAGNHASKGQVYQGPGSMSAKSPDQAGNSNSCTLRTLTHVPGRKCNACMLRSGVQAVLPSSCRVCLERDCCLAGYWLLLLCWTFTCKGCACCQFKRKVASLD